LTPEKGNMPTKPVSVLVTIPVGDELSQLIRAVSPRIEISDAFELTMAEEGGDLSRKDQLDVLLAGAEVIYGFGLPPNVIARAPKLKWIQVMSAGVDRYLNDEVRKSPVTLTNVSGIHAIPISEFVLQLMLMFSKQAPLCFQLKQEKQWERLGTTGLRSKTVGIVGLGHIGREVARLAKAFGMRVVATRRSVGQATSARYVDLLLPSEQLPRLLAESDFVVICVPLTPETDGLIGEEKLRMMKPDAYLINVARGKVVDEEALVKALEEKRIAGAGLDVFATEPLPADSKLWELPNVILSPHISGGMEDYLAQATKVFCENLRRYLSGRRLVNVVSKPHGY
jgi:phosphoglycerate dehydrogenase-like enzyme